MVTYSSHPKTLDEIQTAIQRHLGEPGGKRSTYTIDRSSRRVDRLCFVSRVGNGLRYEMRKDRFNIVSTTWRLHLNLESFVVTTEFAQDKLSLWIESHPVPANRYFQSVVRDLIATKHPSFYSRVVRAFQRLEDELPPSLIDEVTAAPTDYLVAVGALSAAHETAELVAEDPLVAAQFRGLKQKQQMLEAAGGALTSEQVAEVLGITRQAVDKRRQVNQLLALTQGKRGYSYPSFQFEDGNTVPWLEEVLDELSGLDPWTKLVFFTSAQERLKGKTPLEQLRKGLGREVRDVALGYGEQGGV